jgi:hypothetical protein
MLTRLAALRTPARQAGIAVRVVTAAQLLPLGPPSENRAHRRPTATAALRPHFSGNGVHKSRCKVSHPP